jgi:hypothetical protein
VNVYFFLFRADTSVRKLMQPVSTEQTLGERRKELANESIPRSLLGASWKGKDRAAAGGQAAAAGSDRPGSAALLHTGSGDSDGHMVEGEFGSSDTLSTVLAKESFGSAAGAVTRALSKLVDPKLIRPGEHYAVIRDDEGAATSFEYAPTPVLRYVVGQKPDGTWQARKEEKPLVVKNADVSGTIDSSLYESVSKAGESGALVSLLVDLFAWDINLQRSTAARRALSEVFTGILLASAAEATTTTRKDRLSPRACSRPLCASFASARSSTGIAFTPSCIA